MLEDWSIFAMHVSRSAQSALPTISGRTSCDVFDVIKTDESLKCLESKQQAIVSNCLYTNAPSSEHKMLCSCLFHYHFALNKHPPF